MGSVRLVTALTLAAVAIAAPLAAQNLSDVGDLAQLLQLEDSRQFDLGALRAAAQHPDTLVRGEAALAIGRIGDRAGVPLLLTLLQDPDTNVRADAAFALGLLADTAAAEELARQVGLFPATAGGPDQLEMVSALAKIGGPAAARALDGLLQAHPPTGSENDPATADALLEAWRLGRLAPASRLVEYVRSGSGTWRRNAIFSATRLHLAAAAEALLEATADPDPLTRSWAARGLTARLADSAKLSAAAFESRLSQLASDSDAQVRITALRALATFRDSGEAGVALSRIVDQDPNAVVQALTTLGELGGARAAEALAQRFTQDVGFAQRRAALLALARAAPARAVTAGHGWQHDADWRRRAAYADALGIARTDSARARLDSLASDADPRVVAAALTALGAATASGDSAARRLAESRLAHPDVWVRVAALGVLDRDPPPALVPRFVAAYRRAAGDRESDARLAAVGALADVADRSAASRSAVISALLASQPRSPDYLVRRYAAARFGAAAVAQYWGDVYPVATGRSASDYRDVTTALWLPALQGGALPQVTIETDRGNLVVTLYAADAPLTVQNFLDLVDRHFFDGGRWHRVVPDFVIQDGDPRGDGNGGPGYAIRDELNRRRYDRGAVGMALSGPDTGGSQFFITHSPQPHLDGAYTLFGHVTRGDDVLDRIVQGDRIRRIVR
jgi:cyclophilin family peptidyl-prolyl cis-trans isomerase/HEAT repeat protein